MSTKRVIIIFVLVVCMVDWARVRLSQCSLSLDATPVSFLKRLDTTRVSRVPWDPFRQQQVSLKERKKRKGVRDIFCFF